MIEFVRNDARASGVVTVDVTVENDGGKYLSLTAYGAGNSLGLELREDIEVGRFFGMIEAAKKAWETATNSATTEKEN